jgi:hypothetical protein
MSATATSHYSLRIGQHVAGYGNRCEGLCLAQRFDPSQNYDWDVESILAVADDRSGRGPRALETLDHILREAAERQEPIDELGPDLLRRLRNRLEHQGDGTSTTHSGLTAIVVGAGRFFVIKDSPSPAFLLRGGVLLSLPGGDTHGPSTSRYALTPPNGGDPVPVTPVLSDLSTWTAGELEDGDALIVCSQALLECRDESDVARALLQSSSPRMAAGRLAEEAHQRGVDSVVVTALFAGMNPASVPPPRAEASPLPVPSNPYDSRAPMPAQPIAAPIAAAVPIQEALKTPWIAALAGVAGISIGVAIGVVIAVSLLRPDTPAPSGSSPERVYLPGPTSESTSTPHTGSYTGQPTVNSNPSPAYTGFQSNPPANSNPVVRPQTNPIRPGPVNVSGLPPVTQNSTPPRHAIASGMTTKVQVTLYYDQRSGLIIMTSNQGVLYTQDAPLGVPAGEFVAADPGAALRRKSDDPEAELHFVANDQMVARIQGDDFRKLLAGIPISVPDLAPEDYKLLWFSPNDAAAVPPFTNLRIGGI